MPYASTRRHHGIFARKVSKYLMYRRARRLFSQIIRGISAVESRMLRQRPAQG